MIQELVDLVRAQEPTVVFRAETWLDEAMVEGIVWLDRIVEVVWCYFGKKDFDLVIDSFSLNYIDAIFNKGK